jgi:hypothetical protein
VSGVRQLIPRRTAILEGQPVKGDPDYESKKVPSDFAYLRLQEFNERLRSYGKPDWEGKIRPEDHGPMLGDPQGCTDCHNDKTRGALTVMTSQSQIERKLSLELSMPTDTDWPKLLERQEMKNPPLNEEETKRLAFAYAHNAEVLKNLERAKKLVLRRWFLEVPCIQRVVAK